MSEEINLNRSPFLRAALDYIRDNPGCSMHDVINSDYDRYVPLRTYRYRTYAISRLIGAGLVTDRGDYPHHKLFVAPPTEE
jgi:hypothetical protein